MADMWKGSLGLSHALGVVGDKGPEGLQGPPGYQPLYKIGHNEPVWIPGPGVAVHSTACGMASYGSGFPKEWAGPSGSEIPEGVLAEAEAKMAEGVLAEAEAKMAARAATFDTEAEIKKLLAEEAIKRLRAEPGAIVLMPQEFDADNLKAYIQQEIKAGIKEHEIALMRKVAEALADTLVEERKKFKAGTHELNCRLNCRMDDEVYDSKSRLEAHRLEAQEFDKKRALDIAELQRGLQEKVKETTLLRSKLHAASIKKHVRKIKRRNYDRPSESTPKP